MYLNTLEWGYLPLYKAHNQHLRRYVSKTLGLPIEGIQLTLIRKLDQDSQHPHKIDCCHYSLRHSYGNVEFYPSASYRAIYVYSPWGTTNYFDDTAEVEDGSFVHIVYHTNSVDSFEHPSKVR